MQCPECKGTGVDPTRFYRVGPEFEARALGRWPSSATHGIWSDVLWSLCTVQRDLRFRPGQLPEIGCDVARFGDDFTAIHIRWGGTSLHHERHNGWDTQRTANRLMELAGGYTDYATKILAPPPEKRPLDPRKAIRIKVDDDGVGAGVVDNLRANGYRAQGVSAAGRASEPDLYPNRRSELWFSTAIQAKRGALDFTRIDRQNLARIQMQLMAPIWELRQGRRVVEDKAKTKERLRCSPDDADAINIAYLASENVGAGGVQSFEREEKPRARGENEQQ